MFCETRYITHNLFRKTSYEMFISDPISMVPVKQLLSKAQVCHYQYFTSYNLTSPKINFMFCKSLYKS